MPQSSKQETQTREIASAHKPITDQDRQVAVTASGLFQDRKLNECQQHMKKLLDQRPHDPRVISNKAVLDYNISKFTKTDDFMKQMQNVRKQVTIIPIKKILLLEYFYSSSIYIQNYFKMFFNSCF